MAVMIEVRERPILFSGPMVRAILEGRKSMTRRVVKNPEYFGCLTGDCPHWDKKECASDIAERFVPDCPYGKPGDRLWVREGWRVRSICHSIPAAQFYTVQYADYAVMPYSPERRTYLHSAFLGHKPNPTGGIGDWASEGRPSIHMPRWASRITLEVTSVRVERLQDISEDDAVAEGCQAKYVPADPELESTGNPMLMGSTLSANTCFAALWDSINAKKHPRDSNPFVWVVEFKKI